MLPYLFYSPPKLNLRWATYNCCGTASRCDQFWGKWYVFLVNSIVFAWCSLNKSDCFPSQAKAPPQQDSLMVLHVSVSSLTGSHAPSAGRFPGTKFFVRDPGLKLQSRRSRLKQEIKRKQVKSFSLCASSTSVFRAFDLSYVVAEKLSCERHWILVWEVLATSVIMSVRIYHSDICIARGVPCSCTNANIILELEKILSSTPKQLKTFSTYVAL